MGLIWGQGSSDIVTGHFATSHIVTVPIVRGHIIVTYHIATGCIITGHITGHNVKETSKSLTVHPNEYMLAGHIHGITPAKYNQ